MLSRRALETESAKIIAQRAEETVKSTIPGHPRRASVGGPLQSSSEHAALVREVLEVLSASSLVTDVLGSPPFKEGRLQVRPLSPSLSLCLYLSLSLSLSLSVSLSISVDIRVCDSVCVCD